MSIKVHKDLSLKYLNNLRVEAKTKYFVEINSEKELQEFLSIKKYKLLPKFVLGGGCNILFTKDFSGVVLKSAIPNIKIVKETKDYVVIESGSGVEWNSLVTFTVENNYGGIENLALIPGKVGAAPIQNIAAYGQNFSDVCNSLDAVNLATGKTETFNKKRCDFTYRDSVFKRDSKFLNNYFITKVRVKLTKNPKTNLSYWSYKHGVVKDELQNYSFEPYTIKDAYLAISRIRKRKFPNEGIYTVGSFFKNPLASPEQLEKIREIVPDVQYYPLEKLQYIKNDPHKKLKNEYVKVAAGQLLDDGLGWKGKKIGHAGVSSTHALVIETDGNAKPEDVLNVVKKIQKDFYDKFGIELESEARFIPEERF